MDEVLQAHNSYGWIFTGTYNRMDEVLQAQRNVQLLNKDGDIINMFVNYWVNIILWSAS